MRMRHAGRRRRQTRDAGRRQRWRQGLHLHRQRGELTGDPLQIFLLSRGASRERHKHGRVLLLRRLNILQCRADGGVRDRYGNRLTRRLCRFIQRRRGKAAGFRRRGSVEIRKGKAIEFRESEAIEARQGEAIQIRQGVGDRRADDEQGRQAGHSRRHASRSPLLYRVGLLVSLPVLVRYVSHLRSLRVSLVANLPRYQLNKRASHGRSSDGPSRIAQPN